jgi:hypothetical protein
MAADLATYIAGLCASKPHLSKVRALVATIIELVPQPRRTYKEELHSIHTVVA